MFYSEIFIFSQHQDRPWDPLSLPFSVHRGHISWWIKLREREASHSFPSCSDIKIEWNCSSTPPVVVVAYIGTN